MARKLESKQNVSPPSSEYPFGKINDDTGANDGTPINEPVYGDFHQFFEKMMFEAGVQFNNIPDSATNGFQLFEALFKTKSEIDLALNGNFTNQLSDLVLTHTLITKVFATKTDLWYSRGTTIGTGAIYKVPLSQLPIVTPTLTVGLGQLTQPSSMFVDETTGYIYVHDITGSAGNGGVYVYDSLGSFIPSLSLPNLTTPINTSASGICVLPDGDIVVCGTVGGSGVVIYITNGVVTYSKTGGIAFQSCRFSYDAFNRVYIIGGGDIFVVIKGASSIETVYNTGSSIRGSMDIYGTKLYISPAMGPGLRSFNLDSISLYSNFDINDNITYSNLYEFTINNNTLYALGADRQTLRRFTQTLNPRNY